MEQSLSSAFSLLFIGMITVFTVLLLVVLSGKALIAFVNRFGHKKLDALPESRLMLDPKMQTGTSFNKDKLAVLVAAVEVATKGKGKISKIEKL